MAAGGLPGVPGMQQPMSPGSYNSGVMSVGSPVQVRLLFWYPLLENSSRLGIIAGLTMKKSILVLNCLNI